MTRPYSIAFKRKMIQQLTGKQAVSASELSRQTGRRIVGWRVAASESAAAAAELVTQACRDANVDPRGLVLHSDNGAPMRSSTMISTLQWLGVVPSFSRPHLSDDNPYSEGLFRTLEHTPAYPRLPFPLTRSGELVHPATGLRSAAWL
jgi:transposase InsO family protein